VAAPEKPQPALPRIDEESRGWFEGLARHELWLQRCGSCRTIRFYPRAVCTVCLSSEVVWERASGRGTVYTFTVTHQNQAPGFRERQPYIYGIVELAEGVRVPTNIVGCAPESVRIGMPVEVVFDDVTPEITLAKFRPVP
jgi:uncharacterized OB-fold protein